MSTEKLKRNAEKIAKESIGDYWYISGKYQKNIINAMIEFRKMNTHNISTEDIKKQALKYAKTGHDIDSYNVKEKQAFEAGALWVYDHFKNGSIEE